MKPSRTRPDFAGFHRWVYSPVREGSGPDITVGTASMRYEAIPEFGIDDAEEMLTRGDLEGLRVVGLSVAMHSTDAEKAEEICLRLAHLEDRIVRGNSILALGHVARIHRELTERTARPVVEAALRDSDVWIRQQAESAADDIEHSLGWILDRP